jgi:hypothetical protein
MIREGGNAGKDRIQQHTLAPAPKPDPPAHPSSTRTPHPHLTDS